MPLRPTRAAVLMVLLMAAAVTACPAVAQDDPFGEVERLRRAQDYIAATAAATALLPADPAAVPLAAAEGFNLVAAIAYEGADHFMARIANRAALDLAAAAGPQGRTMLAEALLLEAMLDRRVGVRAARLGHRGVSRADMEQRLEEINALLADDPDAHRVRGILLQFRANLERTFAGSVRAVPFYREAVEYRHTHLPRPSIDLAENLVWLAWNLNEAGRHAEVPAMLDAAEAELEALGLVDHTLMGIVHEFRFDFAASAGDYAECVRLATREAEIQLKARAGHSFGDARMMNCPLNGFRRLAWANLRLGDDLAAFEAWSRSLAPVTGEYLGLGADLQALDAVDRERIKSLYRHLDSAVDRAEAEDSSDRVGDAVTALDAWTDLQLSIRAMEGGRPAPTASLAEVQRVLHPDQAVVGQLVTEFGGRHLEAGTLDRLEVWMVVVRREGGIRWIRAQEIAGRELDAQVAMDNRITNTLRRSALWPTRLDPDPDLDRGLRNHAERLMGPVVPALDGIATVISVGTPLSVVMAYCEGVPEAVIKVPSLGALVALSQRARPEGIGERGLVVGVAGDGQVRAAISPDEEVRVLRDLLPHAEVLEAGGATVAALLELDATGDLAQMDFAHFVSHMQMGRTPRRNAIVLTDGLLEAGTMFFATDLRPRSLVLSGCSSLGGGGHTWNEYHGFAQLALGAGVQWVVASRWDVDDRATTLFMERFYRHLLGRGVAQHRPALALAKAGAWVREWRDEDGTQPFVNPIYWAGFVIYGVP